MATTKRKNRNKRKRKHSKQPSVTGQKRGLTPRQVRSADRRKIRKLGLKRQENLDYRKSLVAAE